MRQGEAGGREDDPGSGGGEKSRYDAAAKDEQSDRGAAEDDVLPGFGERAGQSDGRAGDGADGGGAGAIEKGARLRVGAQLVEAPGTEQDEREGRTERDRGGQQSAGEPGKVGDLGWCRWSRNSPGWWLRNSPGGPCVVRSTRRPGSVSSRRARDACGAGRTGRP